jgi:NAD(P)-dependent dehydrogenase (short-subunit alcohol dehydrogenase family)
MKTVYEIMSLKGRRALVTGATGHLGRVICETLRELGADLILIDRDQNELEKLADLLKEKQYAEVKVICADLEKEGQRDNLIQQVIKSCPNLNVLINNAAFVGTSNLEGWAVPFEDQALETWRRAVEVNLTAPFHLVQKLAPIIRVSEGASIINICSIYGFLGPDWNLYEGTKMANPAAYAASKGGLIQLTRWLATTLAPMIRVNSISPGGISRNQPDKFVQKYEKKVPLGRMAVEADITNALCFLATDLSSYITGSNIIIDGGLSST